MAGRNITHRNCYQCRIAQPIQLFSKTQWRKKENSRCSNCVQQSPSPVTVGSAFAPITPPMAGGHPRPAPAPGWGGGFGTSSTGFGGVALKNAAPYLAPQPGTLYQPFGAATPPSGGYGAGPAVATQGVGFGQQAATVGFVPHQPSPLSYNAFSPPPSLLQQQHQQQHHQQHQQQHQQQHRQQHRQHQQHAGFGGHQQAVQAQRQLFAGSGGDAFDTSARMDAEEELWLGQFAPQGGVQFAAFQHQFAQQQQAARAAAAAGTPAPDPRAVQYLTTMAAKGFAAQVQQALELCKNNINKTALVFQKSAKGLGAVQKMKGGLFKPTVTAAMAANGGCMVRAWIQIEQAYKVVATMQKHGDRGASAAGKALQVANNDLVKAAHVLISAQQGAR